MKKIGKIFILMATLALLTVGILELVKRKTVGNFLSSIKNNNSQKEFNDPRAIEMGENATSSIEGAKVATAGTKIQALTLPKNVKFAAQTFSFPYGSKKFSVNLSMADDWYKAYASSEKYYRYYGKQPVNWRESYYGMFLKQKTGDNVIASLVNQLKLIAKAENYNEDQLVELAMNFVQAIPYDKTKAGNISSATPYYPYETLYKKLGICTDKSFLAVLILRQLGYGAAILDYPEVDHASAAIACSGGYDFRGTGYCYIETTNFLPITVVPQRFGANGIITGVSLKNYQGQLDNIFKDDSLGRFEVYQKTTGKIYNGVSAIHARVDKMKTLEKTMAYTEKEIEQMKIEIATKKGGLEAAKANQDVLLAAGDIKGFNNNLAAYNNQVNNYNLAVDNLKLKVTVYNNNVNLYNGLISDFYSIK